MCTLLFVISAISHRLSKNSPDESEKNPSNELVNSMNELLDNLVVSFGRAEPVDFGLDGKVDFSITENSNRLKLVLDTYHVNY